MIKIKYSKKLKLKSNVNWECSEYFERAEQILPKIDGLLKKYGFEIITTEGHGGTFTEFSVVKSKI